MKSLLALARLIDAVTDRLASLAKWAIFVACAVSAGNAVVRYSLDFSSNAFLEIQWYLFAACVMLGAPQVLRVNEHVRVDIFYGIYPTRVKVLVDLMGICLFLIPMCAFIAWSAFPVFAQMYTTGEMSSNSGGLIRWPAMATIPFGMSVLILQALSEVIKRVGWLLHVHDMDTHYERPLQ